MNAPDLAAMSAEQARLARLKDLRREFPREVVQKKPVPAKRDANARNAWCHECGGWHPAGVQHLEYVGHAAVTDRLLEADPDWTWRPFALDARGLPACDEHGGMWIWLTLFGRDHLGYGDAQGHAGPNAVKETIGDAIRNAAMRRGVALYLWTRNGVLESQLDTTPATAPVAASGPLSDSDCDDLALGMRAAFDLVDLQATLKLGWARADERQRAALKAAYDARKTELEAACA